MKRDEPVEDSISQTRNRIAEVLYGDGDELAWARCVQLADLILWEINTGPGD